MLRKKIGRSVTVLAALGFVQASQIAPATAQPAGFSGNCFEYSLYLCNYHAEEIGLYDEPQCQRTVKANCDNGYYYEDVIFNGVVRPLKPEQRIAPKAHRD